VQPYPTAGEQQFNHHNPENFQLLGPVSINGRVYCCTGVLISVMNHRTGQQLFEGERIGLEVEAP
jgi:hypothetical protein